MYYVPTIERHPGDFQTVGSKERSGVKHQPALTNAHANGQAKPPLYH